MTIVEGHEKIKNIKVVGNILRAVHIVTCSQNNLMILNFVSRICLYDSTKRPHILILHDSKNEQSKILA